MSNASFHDSRPLSPNKTRAGATVYAASYGNVLHRSAPMQTSAVSPARPLATAVVRSVSASARSPSPPAPVPLHVGGYRNPLQAPPVTLPSRSSFGSSSSQALQNSGGTNGTARSGVDAKRHYSGIQSLDRVASNDVIVHKASASRLEHARSVHPESNAPSSERIINGRLHNGSSTGGFSGNFPIGMSAASFNGSYSNNAGQALVSSPPPKIGVSTGSVAGSHASRLSGSHGSQRSASPRPDAANHAHFEGSPRSPGDPPKPSVPSKREPLWRSVAKNRTGLNAACDVLQGLLDQKTLGPNEKEDIQFCLQRIMDHAPKSSPLKPPCDVSRSNSVFNSEGDNELLDDQTAAWLASLTGSGKKISFRQVGLTIMAGRRLLTLNRKPAIDLSKHGYELPDGALRDECRKIDSWNDFDVFRVTDLAVSGAVALLHLSTLVLQAHGLVSHFGIDMQTFRKFTLRIGQSYKEENPYHNATHAADVVQSLHALMCNANGKPFSELEQLSAFVAAVCHDVGHEGVTNSYHVNAQTALAVTYSETSCNENMHLAITWGVLSESDNNWMKIFLNDQRNLIKKTMIQIIIATDMANHFTNLQKFNSMVESRGRDVTRWNDTVAALEHLVHTADVSNVAKPMRIAHMWTDRVLEEFFAQGDREREMGLPISNLCDRLTVSRYASQVGFVGFVVKPLFVAVKEICSLKDPLENLDKYAAYNKLELEKENAEKAKEAGAPAPVVQQDESLEAGSSSESDVETNEEPHQLFRPRRRAVCGSKCGHWNRRTAAHGSPPIHPKTPAQHALLRQAILDDPIFLSAVAYGHLDTLAAAIILEPFSAGQTVVQQGQNGKADYFVVEGNFDCFSAEPGMPAKLVAQCEPGQHFGDDVLLWQSDWDFTVSASLFTPPSKPALVGRLDRRIYLDTLVFGNMREFDRKLRCLQQCLLFECMSDEQMSKMVEVLTLKFYRPGDTVYERDSKALHMFVMESGECKVEGGVRNGHVLKAGDIFGEKALLEAHGQEESVIATTEVEILVLSRRKFERLFGKMSEIQARHRAVDPRRHIADLLQRKNGGTGANSDFAVFHTAGRDAMSKLVNNIAVGKTFNVKGKAAKKGSLSGYIPFLQVFDNAHKVDIELSPVDGRTLIYYRTDIARMEAYRILQGSLLQIMMTDKFPIQEPEIKFETSYEPHAFGLDLPEPLVHEVYIERQELQPPVGWETGRRSDPAFMDVNLHALRDKRSNPRVVLLQSDSSEPMNPHGLLMSYAEASVMPVVAGLDPFMIGSKGLCFEPLSPEQVELAMWSVDRASEIVEDKSVYSWTERWLAVLHDVANDGIHHEAPPGGYGDEVSKDLIRTIVKQTAASGAVRGPLECFNFHFPHEMFEEFLVIWNGFDGQPWKVVNEADLQKFLYRRISEGYCFPMNPVWAIRDAGWYAILSSLRKTRAGQQALEAWYPQSFGILSKIDATWNKCPAGFNTGGLVQELPCTTSREHAALILHETKRRASCEIVLRKSGSALEALLSSESIYQRVKNTLMRFMPGISSQSQP